MHGLVLDHPTSFHPLELTRARVARWNSGKPPEEQIRPFGFLLSFMPTKGIYSP